MNNFNNPNIQNIAGFDVDEHELITMDNYNDCIVGIVNIYIIYRKSFNNI